MGSVDPNQERQGHYNGEAYGDDIILGWWCVRPLNGASESLTAGIFYVAVNE